MSLKSLPRSGSCHHIRKTEIEKHYTTNKNMLNLNLLVVCLSSNKGVSAIEVDFKKVLLEFETSKKHISTNCD